MIKWFLSGILMISLVTNFVFWLALKHPSHNVSVQSENLQKDKSSTAIDPISCAEIIESDQGIVEKKIDASPVLVETNTNPLTQWINQFKQYAQQSNWQGMLDSQQSIFDLMDELNDDALSIENIQLMQDVWLNALIENKRLNNESWVDAMLQYIDRQPNDLGVGYFYVSYLVEQNQYDESVSYVNYLKQITLNDQDLNDLSDQFSQLVVDQLTLMKTQGNFTQALSLLNTVLQYEVLNVPFLIQKTDLQILLGDFEGAKQTLSMFEFESDYQQQVDQLKQRIANAPKDHSIALDRYGGQFIVNTIFDDGYQENTIPLLIDTGASISVINERIFLQFVDSSNIRFVRNISVDTAGGKVIAKLYDIDRIQIGEFEVLQTQFMVLPMIANKKYQGLLGMSFLRMFDFNIDQKTAKLHLTPL